MRSSLWIKIASIFILGIAIRIASVYPYNTIIGFDQARDLFDTITIYRDHNLRIIGPTAGNNPYLHHGVLYLYYLVPPLLLFGGNPMAAIYWNIFFNAATGITLFFLVRSLANSNRAGLISVLIWAVSYSAIQYSGWLSNPTVTLFTVPIFYLGLWAYYLGRSWGLVLSALFLGLSIQFELFFGYLVLVLLVVWVVFKLRIPGPKLLVSALFVFTASISTMILAEFKLSFTSLKGLITAGSLVGGSKEDLLGKFLDKFFSSFTQTFLPKSGMVLILILIYLIILKKNKASLFILIYLFSPAIMLLLGYHNAPWFLIALPPAIVVAAGFVLSQIRSNVIVALVLAIVFAFNIRSGQSLLEPDQSALLSSQLRAIDYTYSQSNNTPFTINSVTNPLYINAVWSYHYYWYGLPKYHYLPTWSGGVQLYPYNILSAPACREKLLYLLIDQTGRIPDSYKREALVWADSVSKLQKEEVFGGILVQKRTVTKLCVD